MALLWHILLVYRYIFRYLMHQVQLASEAKDSIFETVTTTPTREGESEVLYSLRPGLTFHFFSSQAPCKLYLVSVY